MAKFITVKIAASITDWEQQEEYERMGIDKDCSEDWDAECDINTEHIIAWHETILADNTHCVMVILSSGTEIPVLMTLKDFRNYYFGVVNA